MKRLLFILLSIICISTSQARGIRDVFINMPDSLLPILTKVNRADCIDFLDYDMRALVKNRFDQESEMTRLTDDYIAMRLSSKHQFEMKLLPVGDSISIICTVQTVGDLVFDSRVNFYTTEWEPLKSQDLITYPTQSDFQPKTIPSQVADTLSIPWENLCAEADILLMHASLSDSTSTLTFHYTTPMYMGKKSTELYSSLLKCNSIQYNWTNGKYIRTEE